MLGLSRTIGDNMTFSGMRSGSIYANSAQRLFTHIGYYANTFSRKSVRDIEHLTHPMPWEKDAYWREICERVKRVISAVFSIVPALVLLLPSAVCYSIAACAGQGRFELIEPKRPPASGDERSVKVMSLNACFQDPWSPLTGGVVPPFDPVGGCASRVLQWSGFWQERVLPFLRDRNLRVWELKTSSLNWPEKRAISIFLGTWALTTPFETTQAFLLPLKSR